MSLRAAIQKKKEQTRASLARELRRIKRKETKKKFNARLRSDGEVDGAYRTVKMTLERADFMVGHCLCSM